MSAATAITAIRPGLGVEFGTHKMLAACTTVPTATENPYLIYKV